MKVLIFVILFNAKLLYELSIIASFKKFCLNPFVFDSSGWSMLSITPSNLSDQQSAKVAQSGKMH